MWLISNITGMENNKLLRKKFQSLTRQMQSAASKEEANKILCEAEDLTRATPKAERAFAEKQMEELEQAAQKWFDAEEP